VTSKLVVDEVFGEFRISWWVDGEMGLSIGEAGEDETSASVEDMETQQAEKLGRAFAARHDIYVLPSSAINFETASTATRALRFIKQGMKACRPLLEWEQQALPEDQVALDGKTVRGASRRRGSTDFDKTGLHAVAAYVPALKTVLDQLVADGKGQELATVKILLGRLPLKGRVYTADALATQRDVCETINAGGGDYLLPVKENQPALLADIQEAFSPSGASQSDESDEARQR